MKRLIEDVPEYPASTHCAECDGYCCKRIPGSVHPKDLGPDVMARVAKMLRSGDYQFDYWEGDWDEEHADLMAYYLRPTVQNGRGRFLYGTWGSPCILLGRDGCKLCFDDRPWGCRIVEPLERGTCTQHQPCGKDNCKLVTIPLWFQYNAEIRELLQKLKAEVVA